MHFHGKIELWTLFLIGAAFHILVRAGWAVRGGKYPSRLNWLYVYWDFLAARTFVAGLIFWTWVSNPQLITVLLSKIGVSLSMELPVAGGTAAGFGYCSDSVLDWLGTKVPFFSREIPPVKNGNPNDHSTET